MWRWFTVCSWWAEDGVSRTVPGDGLKRWLADLNVWVKPHTASAAGAVRQHDEFNARQCSHVPDSSCRWRTLPVYHWTVEQVRPIQLYVITVFCSKYTNK